VISITRKRQPTRVPEALRGRGVPALHDVARRAGGREEADPVVDLEPKERAPGLDRANAMSSSSATLAASTDGCTTTACVPTAPITSV